MSKDVFISYKSEEFGIATEIYERLNKNGVSAWMAPQDIPGGSSYAMEITNAIKNCKIFLLVLSKAAQTSQWIPKEIDNAINEKKLILPFMVEKCTLNAEFSFLLSNIQFKDGYTNREEALKKLIAETKQHLGIKETPPAASPAQGKTASVPPEKIIEFVGKQLNGENPPIVPKTEVKKEEPKRQAYSPYEKNTDSKVHVPASSATPSSAAPASSATPSSAAPASPAAPASSFGTSYSAGTGKKKKPKNKKKIIIASAIIVLVLLVCGFISGLSEDAFTPSITVAGEEFSAKSTFLYIKDKILTEDDMMSIIGFENLSSIEFNNCNITAPVFNQEAILDLSSITIKDCNISQEFYDSIHVGNYQNIYELDISGNPLITDLNINDGEATGLMFLNIAGTSVDNIDTVYSGCKNLSSLDISGTKIRDISFLEGNQKIRTLGIANLELYSLDSLSEMIYLTEVNASENPVGTIDSLSNCVLLTKVNFADCGLSDISVLEKSAEYLTEANLKNNSISDLSPLKDCVKLNVLDITSNDVSSLEALSACTEIKKLFAADNVISSAQGIESLSKLITLDLSKNNITKISSTLVFANGASVYLNDNELTELSLSSLDRYNILSLHNNNLTDGKYLDGLKAYNLTLDYSDNLNLENINTNFTTVTIYGCPLDKQAKVSGSVYGVTFAE